MLLSVPNKLMLLPRADHAKLAAVFPKVVEWRDYAVVPHTVESAQLLNNMGYDAPSPVLHHYDWPIRRPYSPLQHQRITSAFLTLNRRAFVLNDMGTGKTLSMYWAADYLMRMGLVRRALIIAPLSTLERVHGQTLFEHFQGERSFAILHGSAAKRRDLLRHDYDFYIINHDGVGIIEKQLAARADIDLVVVDELAVYRTAGTRRWKALAGIIHAHQWVWGMTGRPCPNEPTDAYAQIKLVRPEALEQYYRSFRAFREATMEQKTMYRWEPKDGAMVKVYTAMQPAIRYSRDECLDLPECTYTTLDVELTADQKKAYKALAQSFVADVNGGKVTAINEAVKLMRLVQVVSGVVYDTNGTHQRIDCGPRLTALREIIEEAPSKVIVFVPFKGNIAFLQEALSPNAKSGRGGWKLECVSGDTPQGERNRIFKQFERPGENTAKVLIAHPACMAHGLNLTDAATVVWWAPIDSNDIYEQACDRINRMGQTRRTTIYHLSGTKVERAAYKRLQGKQKMQGILLTLVEESKQVDKR